MRQPDENAQVHATGWPVGKILVGVGIILLCGGIGIWLIVAIMVYRAPSDAWKFAWKVVSLLVLFGSGALSLHLKKTGYVDRFLKQIRAIGPDGFSVILAIGLGLSLPIGGIIFAQCGSSPHEIGRSTPPNFTPNAAGDKQREKSPNIATQAGAQATLGPGAANKNRECRFEFEPACPFKPAYVGNEDPDRPEPMKIWRACGTYVQNQFKFLTRLSVSHGYDGQTFANEYLDLVQLVSEKTPCLNGDPIGSSSMLDVLTLSYDGELTTSHGFKDGVDVAYFCVKQQVRVQTSQDAAPVDLGNSADPAFYYSNVVTVRRICQ